MYFTTTRKELLPKSVAYEGAGLELGECGAKLPGANYSDAGDWSCHMGLQRGPELEARVPVIVTGLCTPIEYKLLCFINFTCITTSMMMQKYIDAKMMKKTVYNMLFIEFFMNFTVNQDDLLINEFGSSFGFTCSPIGTECEL